MMEGLKRFNKIRNLTGHDISITDSNTLMVLPSEGRARLISDREIAGEVSTGGMTIPVFSVIERTVIGLPDAEEGVLHVVSGMVASYANRDDVVAPGQIYRDVEHGRVRVCKTFIRPHIKENR